MIDTDHNQNRGEDAAENPALLAAKEKLRQANEAVAMAEMPRYKCHKTVHALKISAVMLDVDEAKSANRETDGSAMIYPEDQGYAPFRVDQEYVRKHKPEAGGYYIVYDDGYKSFSPAKAFEDGYTRI